jgi:hypothetical protein
VFLEPLARRERSPRVLAALPTTSSRCTPANTHKNSATGSLFGQTRSWQDSIGHSPLINTNSTPLQDHSQHMPAPAPNHSQAAKLCFLLAHTVIHTHLRPGLCMNTGEGMHTFEYATEVHAGTKSCVCE